MAKTFVFLMLIVRPNSLQASEKQLIRSCSPASVCAESAINNLHNINANMGINLNLLSREFAGFQLCHDNKQVTRSNFDNSWNCPPQLVFIHGQLYVAMSGVKSYNDLQFALALPSGNSITMTSYTNNVVFKSALLLYW